MHGALSSVRLLHSTSLTHFLQCLPRSAFHLLPHYPAPPARVKRASPARQAGNPRGIRVSGAPARKRPIGAGYSTARFEMPKRRGVPAGRSANYCGRLTRCASYRQTPKDTGLRPAIAASHCKHSARRAHLTPLAHSLQCLPHSAHRLSPHYPPLARVKRASPARQAGNPRGIRVSGAPARKRPIDAGSSTACSETPKRRGVPAGHCGRPLRTFSPRLSAAAALRTGKCLKDVGFRWIVAAGHCKRSVRRALNTLSPHFSQIEGASRPEI